MSPLPDRLLSHLPLREPAVHLRKDDGEPQCGQRDATGKGRARTRYTRDPGVVTCRKCLKAIARDDTTREDRPCP